MVISCELVRGVRAGKVSMARVRMTDQYDVVKVMLILSMLSMRMMRNVWEWLINFLPELSLLTFHSYKLSSFAL